MMKDLFSSKTTIFTERDFLTSSCFFLKVKQVASYFKKNGLNENSVCLLNLRDPLETLIGTFALILNKSIVALKNPKLPESYDISLKEDLGQYVEITNLGFAAPENDIHSIDYEKIAFLMATSGSSGKPKWIASNLRMWIHSAEGTLYHLEASCAEPWILNLPLFHVSGLSQVFRAFLINAPLIISSKIEFVSFPRVSLIPHQVKEHLKQKTFDQFLKASSVLIGGGFLDEATFHKIKHFPISLTYGMTEAMSQITSSKIRPEDFNLGHALKHRDLKLSDDHKIYIKGSCVADYIWKNGSLLRLKDDDGYYLTNDQGVIRNDGTLALLGRVDERIEIKGEKIYPSIIEHALQKHFDFHQLCVTHIIDAAGDPLVVAFSDPLPDEISLINLKKQVGTLFFPKYFLPLNSHNRNQKILLKDLKSAAAKFIFDK
jgi:o-succinylbenzoate---CoA ligase